MNSKVEIEKEWLHKKVLPWIMQSEKIDNNDENNNRFVLKNIEIKYIGYEEAFMLTSCYRGTVRYLLDGELKTLLVFVKKTPELTQDIYDAINFGALFGNEKMTYETIFPAIEQFSKIKINAPVYICSDVNKNSASFVLKDFSSDNYLLTEAKYDLSLEHVVIAVRYLAKFHGIGFAFKEKQKEKFESLTQLLQESRFANSNLHPDYEITLKITQKRAWNAARKYHPQISEQFIHKLQSLFTNYSKYGKKLVTPVEPIATLCHGDYLRNNIAFKYDQETNLPIDVMMFDLQTMRYSSPMVDLSVLLAASTFASTRFKHFQQIFDVYCTELASIYIQLTNNSVVPEFLSYNSLLREYIRFLPYAITVSASFLLELVEPNEQFTEQLMQNLLTPEEIEKDLMVRGGEIVDIEIAHQVKELYSLCEEHSVDIFNI